MVAPAHRSALSELTRQIQKLDSGEGDVSDQSAAFMKSVDVLSSPDLQPQDALYTDPDLLPISGYVLVMFSFPKRESSQLKLVEERITRSLEASVANVRGFHTCLSNVRSRFILVRKTQVSQVLQYMSLVAEWALPRLERSLAHSDRNTPSQNVRLAYECLCFPAFLRSRPQYRADVLRLLSAIEPRDLAAEVLPPGLLTYLVEGSAEEQAIASKIVSLQHSELVLDPQTIDEFNHHFYRLQNARFFTPELSSRFWAMVDLLARKYPEPEIAKLLKPAELEIMSSHTEIVLYPLLRVLLNNVMARLDSPLPALLRTLDTMLQLYKADFWQLSDGHFSNVLDTVLPSPFFHQHLHRATIEPDSGELPQLTKWMYSFLASLAGPPKTIAAVKLADFLVQRESSEPSNTQIDSANILLGCFDVSESSTSVSLLKLRDVRAAVSKHCAYFFTLLGHKSAMSLICRSLKYDILVNASNSDTLKSQEIPVLHDSSPAVWTTLTAKPVRDPAFVAMILESFAESSLVIIFKDSNTKLTREMEAALKIHNREAKALGQNISNILEKVALLDPEDLTILADEKCSAGLWNCVFSPQTSQAALSVLYQISDAQGRLEAISGCLNKALEVNLHGINQAVTNVTNLKVYEPCPKALRILMDVVTALTDPLKGILNTQTTSHASAKRQVRQLWERCWGLLVMIYKETFVWAKLYHLADLLEFTRDTLDISHLLLDSFRPLLEFFSDPELQAPLFETFMATFIHAIVWLRLGDISLLNSCVNLVFKGFDLAKELGANVDKTFIITFAKYGARAKKFNNKLSEQQRNLILAKASEFDSKLVEYVIEQATRDSKPSSASTTPQPEVRGATYAYQTKPKGPIQSTLSRFGVVTKEAPVAPPPPVKSFKANNMEAIRSELKSNRLGAAKPVINPAPPRPAGFNSKATAVGRSLNALKKKADSDSSDEDEEDVDVSDLFIANKKKAKIIELDINGRPVTKLAVAKKADNQRKEEENMRLRLNVNLKPLYSTVLKWNYTTNSEFPTEDRDIYHEVKSAYSNARDYVSSIEPLLMLECWQGIQSSRVTGQELAFELLVGSRTTCDGFFDVYVSMKKADLSERKLSDNDLLVLGYVADKDLGSMQEISKYLKSPGSQTCLAKVRDIKYANADFCDVTVRVYPQGSMMGLLTPQSVIVGMKVMQMTTVEREYSSLKGVQYYDLCDEILQGSPAPPPEISDQEASDLCQKLGLNLSQAKAIIGSSQQEGFSLIQGPPGTGKTKTILGIVGHFLSTPQKPNVISVPGKPSVEESKSTKKVLICAPSNAAVDELVVRLKDGVVNDSGVHVVPKLVRLGRSDAMNVAVRDCSLEELIEGSLKATASSVSIDPNIRVEFNKCLGERDRIRQELKNGDLRDEEILERETKLRELNKKRNELGKKLDEQRENVSIATRTREIHRRQVQAKILSEAQVICSTLSGSAHDFLASMSMKFDQVIIDEACQCVELSAIIPLRYGCKKCVMVGDPNQLPPTVLSQRAASFKYEESLFVRMQRNNSASTYLLDIQYRMHPDISRFPSAQFYGGKLSDGPGMLDKNTRPWHTQGPLSPYRFFDVTSRHEQSQLTKSFFNQAEARLALEMVQELWNTFPDRKWKGSIGIISPYKEQVRTLKNVFQRKFGSLIFNEIDFNTVDGFQGQEKEIIIMSCVRASDTGRVGFLSDIRRMNVALTRARTTLWILGNKQSLKRDKVWNKLITDAESRSAVTTAEPGFLRKYNFTPARQITQAQTAPAPRSIPAAPKSTPAPPNPTLPEPADGNSENLPSASAKPEPKQVEKRPSENVKPKKHKKAKVYIHNGEKPSEPIEKSAQPEPSAPSNPSLPPKPSSSGVYRPAGPKKTNSSVFIQKRRGMRPG